MNGLRRHLRAAVPLTFSLCVFFPFPLERFRLAAAQTNSSSVDYLELRREADAAAAQWDAGARLYGAALHIDTDLCCPWRPVPNSMQSAEFWYFSPSQTHQRQWLGLRVRFFVDHYTRQRKINTEKIIGRFPLPSPAPANIVDPIRAMQTKMPTSLHNNSFFLTQVGVAVAGSVAYNFLPTPPGPDSVMRTLEDISRAGEWVWLTGTWSTFGNGSSISGVPPSLITMAAETGEEKQVCTAGSSNWPVAGGRFVPTACSAAGGANTGAYTRPLQPAASMQQSLQTSPGPQRPLPNSKPVIAPPQKPGGGSFWNSESNSVIGRVKALTNTQLTLIVDEDISRSLAPGTELTFAITPQTFIANRNETAEAVVSYGKQGDKLVAMTISFRPRNAPKHKVNR